MCQMPCVLNLCFSSKDEDYFTLKICCNQGFAYYCILFILLAFLLEDQWSISYFINIFQLQLQLHYITLHYITLNLCQKLYFCLKNRHGQSAYF